MCAQRSAPGPDDVAAAFEAFGPTYVRWLHAAARAEGLSLPRLRLLRALDVEGPQIMTRLGDVLGVTARSVTALVDGLEVEGHVRRLPHQRDRRATVIELTEAGRELVSEMHAAHTRRASELFARLEPDERRDLLRIVRKLSDELVSLGADVGCLAPEALSTPVRPDPSGQGPERAAG